MLLSIASTTAVDDDDDAAEDHRRGKDLLPCQHVSADGYAYHYCDDRLHIAVHADEGRSDASLRHRYKEICNESGAYDQVGQLGILD